MAFFMRHSIRLLNFLLVLAATVCQADSSRPNILFAIADDASAPHMSAYGTKGISTPAFDRVAKSGALFTSCVAASPGCAPSRAAVLTGRHAWSLEQAGTHASSFPSKWSTFPDRLSAAGYHVGYTGKGWGPGRWNVKEVGARDLPPTGKGYAKRKAKPPAKGISNNDYASNFADFLSEWSGDEPFCFWYGATEPHRVYEDGYGKRLGKSTDDADVPAYLPDNETVRSDMLDYFAEIEHFDAHLGRMLAMLDERGELANTLVIVTADNGMPFPRAKANCYEDGINVPLAVMWPAAAPGGRVVEDVVGFVDLTATIDEAAGVSGAITQEQHGSSLVSLLKSDQSGVVDPNRVAFSHRERHSSSRFNNWTYPQRAVRSQQYLLIINDRAERWPAGDPRKFDSEDQLGPQHGGYHDIDACPSLTVLTEGHDDPELRPYLELSVAKRPAVEFFDIKADPACLKNLATSDDAAVAAARSELMNRLQSTRESTGDPRTLGNGEIFETYPRYSRIRSFPEPPEKLPK